MNGKQKTNGGLAELIGQLPLERLGREVVALGRALADRGLAKVGRDSGDKSRQPAKSTEGGGDKRAKTGGGGAKAAKTGGGAAKSAKTGGAKPAGSGANKAKQKAKKAKSAAGKKENGKAGQKADSGAAKQA